MKFLNVVVEGGAEEAFVNGVLTPHFAELNLYVSSRKIRTGWDRRHKKPAKGGLLKYPKFKNDLLRWIQADRGNNECWYSCMLDLYAFPQDDQSPYTPDIRAISDPYPKINALEQAITNDIAHPRFIAYVQLHEFETFLLVDPDRLSVMYPDAQTGIKRLKKEIGTTPVEEINESRQTAPSKRIIAHLPDYEWQKAQVGPLVVEDIGLPALRENCPHFDAWISRLELLAGE